MKKIILLSLFILGCCSLFAQQKTENLILQANAYTKNVKSILSNMPVNTISEDKRAELRAINKQQTQTLQEIHENMILYVLQIKQKYGENSEEVKEEITYQQNFYFKQLKTLLNTHQFAYLKSIQDAKTKDLIDYVDVNAAAKEEIEAAKQKLSKLQSLSFINFNEL